MTREIIAVVLSLIGLATVLISVFILGGWVYIAILTGCVMLALGGILGSKPDRPDNPV